MLETIWLLFKFAQSAGAVEYTDYKTPLTSVLDMTLNNRNVFDN